MPRNDKTRPAELVGLSALAGVFVGGVVLMVTRDIMLSSVAGGGVFVVTIVTLAMMVLAMSPQTKRPSDNPHD